MDSLEQKIYELLAKPQRLDELRRHAFGVSKQELNDCIEKLIASGKIVKGAAEINIAKHRSGPTDKIELTWVSRYTKFSDKAL